ncbi:MAG: hypothetical protein U9R25_11660 [Chloroflexota bacterium]|nr:hypothetical protein [Chloroflexota bacterium]
MDSDFRDRISIAVWGVVITLAASALFSLPGRDSEVMLGATTLALPVDLKILTPLLLALLAGTGAQAVVNAHPLVRQGKIGRTGRFWALPIAVTVIGAMLLPTMPSLLYWIVGLLTLAVLLSGVLVAIYYSLDPHATGYRRARIVLNLTCYAVALLAFLLIPDTWRAFGRSLTLGLIATLLALEILRGTESRVAWVSLYASIVGVVVAQVTWALVHTNLSTLSAGLLLLLLFYLLVGLSWQTLLERLDRRVALEFAAVGAAGLILILAFAP